MNKNEAPIQFKVTNKTDKVQKFKVLGDDDNGVIKESMQEGLSFEEIEKSLHHKTDTSLVRVQKMEGDLTQEVFLSSAIIFRDEYINLIMYNSAYQTSSFVIDMPIQIDLKTDNLRFTIPPKCTLHYTLFFSSFNE